MSGIRRIKMVVAYDGTNYCGWQVQPNGITIEEVLNRELTALLKEPVKVTGASRTDSGVHALGNVAVFDTASRIPGDKFAFALNQKLPDDIVIQGSCEVDKAFHPRFCESRKTYEYKIINRTFYVPTMRFDTHFVHYPMDVEAMREAAAFLVGEHDFKSFCTDKPEVTNTVRKIHDIQISGQDGLIRIRVCGAGFLYNMVRIIAGTLMQAATGYIRPEEIKAILAGKDRALAGPTAPAKGLTLIGIEYKG